MVTKAGGTDLPAKGPGLGTAVRYAPPAPKSLQYSCFLYDQGMSTDNKAPPHPHREWRQQNPASWGPCQGKGGL